MAKERHTERERGGERERESETEKAALHSVNGNDREHPPSRDFTGADTDWPIMCTLANVAGHHFILCL